MNLIEIHGSGIRLNSGLDEYSFGKTNYDSILAQEGVFWDGEKFEPWAFNDVQSFNVEGKSERIVFYCGNNLLEGTVKTLQQWIEEGSTSALAAAKAVCTMLTQAAKDGNAVPMVGAGGILVALADTNKGTAGAKVIMLPEQLFKYAANALGAHEYTLAHEGWINQTITGLPALCFLRAGIAYRLLSGHLPYPNTDPVERNADILDRNFLPLELCVQGINQKLAVSINRALKLNSNAVNVPGKKQKGKSSEDLTPEPDFPLELLDEAYTLAETARTNGTDANSDTDFAEKVAAYKKSQITRVRAKRGIRRNMGLIIAALITIFVFVLITINTVKTHNEELSTIGLTSVQTIQGFFQGINAKNTTQLMNFVKGKNPQHHIDVVSQIYVLHKQRRTYSKDNGYGNPANWLFFITNEQNWINSGVYGVTHLKVDGQPLELNLELHSKADKVPPVTQEGSVALKNDDHSVHIADYYLLHTEGDDFSVVIEKVHETFTLTYKKNRWVITKIETETETLPISTRLFKADYWNRLAENGGDVMKTVSELRPKYTWLPSDTAMQDEYDAQIYAITHPLEALGF